MKLIVVDVHVLPGLSPVEPIAYRECLFAMESNIAQMDQTKIDAKLKIVKVKEELDNIY